MTGREKEALPSLLGFVIGLFAAAVLFTIFGLLQRQDAKDDAELRAQVAAKVRAQDAKWSELDRKARYMTSYDEIGK